MAFKAIPFFFISISAVGQKLGKLVQNWDESISAPYGSVFINGQYWDFCVFWIWCSKIYLMQFDVICTWSFLWMFPSKGTQLCFFLVNWTYWICFVIVGSIKQLTSYQAHVDVGFAWAYHFKSLFTERPTVSLSSRFFSASSFQLWTKTNNNWRSLKKPPFSKLYKNKKPPFSEKPPSLTPFVSSSPSRGPSELGPGGSLFTRFGPEPQRGVTPFFVPGVFEERLEYWKYL